MQPIEVIEMTLNELCEEMKPAAQMFSISETQFVSLNIDTEWFIAHQRYSSPNRTKFIIQAI